MAVPLELYRHADPPGARLPQRLWRAPAGAVLFAVVLRRHAVHRRCVAVGTDGLRDMVLAAARRVGWQLDTARADRDRCGAGGHRGGWRYYGLLRVPRQLYRVHGVRSRSDSDS